MNPLHYLAYFFGGAFLTNALPHLLAGLMGRPLQTPFATPPGQGLSSSIVNLLWGFANLAFAYPLLCQVGAFDIRNVIDALATGLGGLLIGLLLAHRFGQFNGGANPAQAKAGQGQLLTPPGDKPPATRKPSPLHLR